MVSAATALKSARKAAGLTQAELAKRAGTTQPVVARMERSGSNPRLGTLSKMIAATGHTLALSTARGGSVDETMIASDLALTPDERLRRFEELYSFAQGIGGIALAADGP